MKRRYRILLIAPEYTLEIQTRIPCALAAVHNFIRENDEDLQELDVDDDEDVHGGGIADPDAEASIREAADDDEPSALRDSIADAMWEQYIAIRDERGMRDDNDNEDE